MTVLASLLTALFLSRRRWVLAGLCGAVAVLAHSFGVAVVAAAVVYALVDQRKDLASALRSSVAAGLPGLVAYAAWFVHLRVVTGMWTSYFRIQASYDHDAGLPPVVLARRLRGQIKNKDYIPDYAGWAHSQEVVLTLLIMAAVAIAVRKRAVLTRTDWAALAIGIALWCAELQAGTSPSFWRLAVLCAPIAVVLRHGPALVPAVAVVALLPMEFALARGFFEFKLT
jgi:hypothetical protein